MLGDYMTKPLVGWKFAKSRDFIMNLSNKYHQVGQNEYDGELHKEYWPQSKSESKYEILTRIWIRVRLIKKWAKKNSVRIE